MRLSPGKRLWAACLVTVVVLSVIAGVVSYWTANHRPRTLPIENGEFTAVSKEEVGPSPPVYDTVSPMKQQDR